MSSPLSAEDYLNAYKGNDGSLILYRVPVRSLHVMHSLGSAVGIDVTPARFVDPEVRDILDPVVRNIKGLYLTGQDTLICGVTLAQVSHMFRKSTIP
jgi:hypothetical protein